MSKQHSQNGKDPSQPKRKHLKHILPCLMYGAETITWRKDLLRMMDVFQNKIMRICTKKKNS